MSIKLPKIKPINVLGVLAGSFLSAIALKMFVSQANLVPAGIVGLATLLNRELSLLLNINIPYSVLYIVLNLMIFLFVYRSIGKRFLLLSLIHIFASSIFVELIPTMVLTDDVILLTIFGGVLNGIGVTLALKSGGSSGGTDFIAIYYSAKNNKPMWNQIMIFNFMMLIYNGWAHDWNSSFYSIIYQFASTEILSNNDNRYKLSSLHIITQHADEVADSILSVVRHGITRFEGLGVYRNREQSMLYTVVNSFEIKLVIDAVKDVDPKAFIEVSTVDRIEGNYRQKPLE